MKTNDGGITWRQVYRDSANTSGINNTGNLIQKNSNEFFVNLTGSTTDVFLYSSDKGETWISRGTGDAAQFGRVKVSSESLAFTSGGNTNIPRYVLRTKDGGFTWTKVYTGAVGLFRSVFVRDFLVWSVGANRSAVYSNDGGDTWNLPVSFGAITAATEFRDVAFNSSGIGLLAGRVGTNGQIARSIDGGLNWSIVFSPASWVTSVKFISETTAIATSGVNGTVSSYGVYLSNDSGLTWTQLSSMAGITLYDTSVISANTIYVSSGAIATATSAVSEFVYKTTNGGSSWDLVFNQQGIQNQNLSIGFRDENNGFISGSSGTFRTSNGGVSWEKETTWSDTGFLGISFLPSGNRVIASGGAGSIQIRPWP
jgi:photosystem II stability/assembly factor-like uncharacterized protein